MKLAVQGSAVYIIEASDAQAKAIKAWGLMQWDRKQKMFSGTASADLFDRLSGICKLSPSALAKRAELIRIQEAVDRERANPAPVPLAAYPVKAKLYQHQIRGANMALLTFGWVQPQTKGTRDQ